MEVQQSDGEQENGSKLSSLFVVFPYSKLYRVTALLSTNVALVLEQETVSVTRELVTVSEDPGMVVLILKVMEPVLTILSMSRVFPAELTERGEAVV